MRFDAVRRQLDSSPAKGLLRIFFFLGRDRSYSRRPPMSLNIWAVFLSLLKTDSNNELRKLTHNKKVLEGTK